ncbi:TNF receptor-associated factor family protein DDB_G0272098-like isoform X2 [Macrobrachium rosenbergii]|uniref:TNF receptor-associated factor family protein DDB_G0272098-like isoform X2 n=1 Tax=Macrobrachium rosenbergii TaxID=79674 RepID=UPI0034D69C20
MRHFLWVLLLGLSALAAAQNENPAIAQLAEISPEAPQSEPEVAEQPPVEEEPATDKAAQGILEAVSAVVGSFRPSLPSFHTADEAPSTEASEAVSTDDSAVAEAAESNVTEASVPVTTVAEEVTDVVLSKKEQKAVKKYNEATDKLLAVLAQKMQNIDSFPIQVDEAVLLALDEVSTAETDETQQQVGNTRNNNKNKKKNKNKNKKNKKNKKRNNKRKNRDGFELQEGDGGEEEEEEEEEGRGKKKNSNENNSPENNSTEKKKKKNKDRSNEDGNNDSNEKKKNKKKKNKDRSNENGDNDSNEKKNKKKNKGNKNKRNRNNKKNKKNASRRNRQPKAMDDYEDEDIVEEGRRKGGRPVNMRNRNNNMNNNKKNKKQGNRGKNKNRKNKNKGRSEVEARKEMGPVMPTSEERSSSNARLTGLSNLVRDGDVTVDLDGKKHKIEAHVTVGPLTINHKDKNLALKRAEVSTNLEAVIKLKVKPVARRAKISVGDVEVMELTPEEVAVKRSDLDLQPDVITSAQEKIVSAIDTDRLGRVIKAQLEEILDKDNTLENLENHPLLRN